MWLAPTILCLVVKMWLAQPFLLAIGKVASPAPLPNLTPVAGQCPAPVDFWKCVSIIGRITNVNSFYECFASLTCGLC